ncbi:hypothetical protein Tco_0615883, partial [Tanacetum coccineum]
MKMKGGDESPGDEDDITFVVDGMWWAKSACILAGQYSVVLAAMAGQRHGKGDCSHTKKTLLRFVAGEIDPYLGRAARCRACSHSGSHSIFPRHAFANLNSSFLGKRVLLGEYGYIKNCKKTVKKTSKHGHENGRVNKAEARKVKPQSKSAKKNQ